MIKLNPYLTFSGNARDALSFYETVFGGDLTLQSYKDMQSAQTPEFEDQILHGQLITADGMTLMGSDDPEGQANPSSIAINGDDEATIRSYWDKLADGATIISPLANTPWGDTFGLLTDKFGMRWLINIITPKTIEA